MKSFGKGIFALMVSGGFVAIVGGLFGYGADILKRPDAIEDRRCTIASQILLDETPNPYISRIDHQRIGREAARRLDICLEGKHQ